MKRVFITGIGAIALVGTLQFLSEIPVVARQFAQVGEPAHATGSNIWQSGIAIAQNVPTKGQVELSLNAEKKVVLDKQKESWQDLGAKAMVQPGDVLRYIVTAKNNGELPVKNLTINQRVPKGMVYVLKSASASNQAKITYSIDGGRNFVETPTVKVKLANGKVETKPAPATAYTHIRWNFGTSVAAKATVKGMYVTQVR
jgi:uncharacterized repeat protein (TIGR01451 family)